MKRSYPSPTKGDIVVEGLASTQSGPPAGKSEKEAAKRRRIDPLSPGQSTFSKRCSALVSLDVQDLQIHANCLVRVAIVELGTPACEYPENMDTVPIPLTSPSKAQENHPDKTHLSASDAVPLSGRC